MRDLCKCDRGPRTRPVVTPNSRTLDHPWNTRAQPQRFAGAVFAAVRAQCAPPYCMHAQGTAGLHGHDQAREKRPRFKNITGKNAEKRKPTVCVSAKHVCLNFLSGKVLP